MARVRWRGHLAAKGQTDLRQSIRGPRQQYAGFSLRRSSSFQPAQVASIGTRVVINAGWYESIGGIEDVEFVEIDELHKAAKTGIVPPPDHQTLNDWRRRLHTAFSAACFVTALQICRNGRNFLRLDQESIA